MKQSIRILLVMAIDSMTNDVLAVAHKLNILPGSLKGFPSMGQPKMPFNSGQTQVSFG
jgi:hypothetical protein